MYARVECKNITGKMERMENHDGGRWELQFFSFYFLGGRRRRGGGGGCNGEVGQNTKFTHRVLPKVVI